MRTRHRERHRIENIGWLRAAVLGANDGIVSTSSLILGVAASHASHSSILIAGVSALAAGAMSMATGEYVSVHSQLDTERAAIEEERGELQNDYPSEQRELAGIYVRRGLKPEFANEVAAQLMQHNALEAHARDELGISSATSARPIQAALASAASFSVGALLPLILVAVLPEQYLILGVALASLAFLALLGGLGASAGGAAVLPGVLRVTFWSALAMAVTAGIGSLFGTVPA